MSITYDAVFEEGDESGYVVTFPDVPEAITQRKTFDEAYSMAQDALAVALQTYVERGLPLPKRTRTEVWPVLATMPGSET